ncbi:hypothetical protein INR49_008858 [Caranx melampygus]|nr:hypothetical protein INR49_008858 [Caranx melampygus]
MLLLLLLRGNIGQEEQEEEVCSYTQRKLSSVRNLQHRHLSTRTETVEDMETCECFNVKEEGHSETELQLVSV